jgi:hypothetical protein
MRIKKCSAFIFSFVLLFNIYAYAGENFNLNNIYSTTSELCQEKYRGRLAGDKGNTLAAEYIEKYFKAKGLMPAGDKNTYLQSFQVIVPVIDGACSFKIFDLNGRLIKEYLYGRDFKELSSGASMSGTVKGTLSTDLYSSSPIYLEESSITGESLYTYNEDNKLLSCGIKGVVVPSTGDFRFRSPYKLQQPPSNGLIKIAVHKDIMPELMTYSQKGYTFEIKSSLSIQSKTVSNVIGILKGWDPTLPPLILSAHFDHVGFDADGTIYPGALDNASGAAMLLECVNAVKNSGSTQRTVIFAAFNAEEEGLIGSSYFVQHPPMDISHGECINFDMVGSAKDLPLSLLCCDTRTLFSNEIAGIAKSLMVNTNMLYEANSDHVPFTAAGINSLTLIHDDVEKIHTPYDTIENVSLDNLRDVAAIMDNYLAYDGKVIVQETIDETAVSAPLTPSISNTQLNLAALVIAIGAILLQVYILSVKIKKGRNS